MESPFSHEEDSKPVSPFQNLLGAFQSSEDAEAHSAASEEGPSNPGIPVPMDRLRSTLPTESDALPADLKVKPGFHMPKLSPRRFSPKVKRNTSILKMLRKPKPNWKNLLKGRKSEGSDSGRLSTIDQGDEEEESAGSEPVGSPAHDEGERLASHHSMTPGLLSQGRDLHVNVICARGLRAADSNGLSDPYTVVRLGSRSKQTHVLLETLDPDWNEAFVFSAEEIEAAMVSSVPSLLFEVWDSDIGVVADDFLGQADITLADIKLQEEGQVFRLPLYLTAKGERIDSGLGYLEVAVWAKESVTGDGQPLSAISALCPVPGQIEKKLPAVIHDERGNTVYEEPCVAWLHLRIVQVAVAQVSSESDDMPLIKKIFTVGTSASRWRSFTSLGSSLSRQQSSSSTTSVASIRETMEPSPRFKERRSLHRVISESDEGGGGGGEAGLRSVHRKIKKLFGKVDDEEQLTAGDDFELEGKESESEEGEDAEEEAGDEQQLYWEVSVGNQTKRSRLAPLQNSRAKWGQDFAFAVVLPLRTRPLRLELHQSSGRRRKGRTIACAYIPLANLFPDGSTEIGRDGEWFRLHDASAGGSFEGAVALAAACVDVDFRRQLYGLPMAVPPEQRQTRHSVQKSETSASSLQRLSMGSSESPKATSGEESLADRLSRGSGGWSLLPNPARLLDTCREQSNELATSSSKSSHGSGRRDSSSQSCQPAAAPDTQRRADEEPQANEGVAQQEQENIDAEEPEMGKTVTRPLPWLTWLAQKLYAQPAPPPSRPVAQQPLGMLQLVIKAMDLEQGSDSCFCLLRCGPLWGRSTTQPSSSHLDFNWEVHTPIFDPGTVLQLALFKETGPRTSRRTQMVGLLRLRLSSLATDTLHSTRLPLCASRRSGGERSATVSYFSRLRLLRKYLSPPQPTGIYRHGLAGGDVRYALERETARITMRWLETSSPPIPRSVADCLLRSPQDMFLMSRTKAHWRRLSVWVEGGKRAGEGWAYLQTWDNPPATLGTMAGMTALCCYPHIIMSLAATALVLYMVFAYPSEGVGEPRPMEPDPEAKEDDDDDSGDKELQGTLVQRLQARVENMQRIALKVQNALDEIASALERVRAVVCWADPTASAFFLIIAMAAALLISVLGLHTLVSFLLCWMLRPPFLRVPRPPPPYSFLLRLPNNADQIP
ncbi:probable FT-interacting protein 3 [Coccomyxa sp. Obi]|nr:probable FT-interacting protein 3 [Coccomyxa sp. Obi]